MVSTATVLTCVFTLIVCLALPVVLPVFHLLHITHHGTRCQRPSQGCCGIGGRSMDLRRTADNLCRANSHDLHKAVHGHTANQIVFHFRFPFLALK